MRIEEALFRYLSGVSGVTALLGSGSACKLWEQEAPDGQAMPYATFSDDSNEGFESFGHGASNAQRVQFTFEIFAATPQAADAIAQALYNALLSPSGTKISFSGVMGGTGGVTVLAILFVARDSSAELDYYSTSRMYLENLSVTIFYTI